MVDIEFRTPDGALADIKLEDFQRRVRESRETVFTARIDGATLNCRIKYAAFLKPPRYILDQVNMLLVPGYWPPELQDLLQKRLIRSVGEWTHRMSHIFDIARRSKRAARDLIVPRVDSWSCYFCEKKLPLFNKRWRQFDMRGIFKHLLIHFKTREEAQQLVQVVDKNYQLLLQRVIRAYYSNLHRQITVE